LRKAIIATLLVAGCTTVSAPMAAKRFEALTTSHLWSLHYTTADPLEMGLIETELALRGETNTYGDFIGRKTASAFGQPLYGREAQTVGDMNCSDFPSAAAAQKFFLTAGGPRKDTHGLDGDGDGLACEWGAHLKRVAAKGAKSFRSTRSRCYVGPRGGTYTVTASGRKNYGGC
jgi:hypothetical protein